MVGVRAWQNDRPYPIGVPAPATLILVFVAVIVAFPLACIRSPVSLPDTGIGCIVDVYWQELLAIIVGRAPAAVAPAAFAGLMVSTPFRGDGVNLHPAEA